jgi:hypothetical protein
MVIAPKFVLQFVEKARGFGSNPLHVGQVFAQRFGQGFGVGQCVHRITLKRRRKGKPEPVRR